VNKPAYTPSVLKLLQHPDNIRAIANGCAWPVTINIAVTGRCQLACSFCCFKNRPVDMDLSWNDFMHALLIGRPRWTRGIEITGGEPGLWPELARAIRAASRLYKVGLVTNGAAISVLSQEDINLCHWVRVSLNGFEQNYDIPDVAIQGRLTGSLVWHDKFMPELLRPAISWCKRNHTHLRVLVDAFAQDREALIAVAQDTINSCGEQVFLDPQKYKQLNGPCLYTYWKPLVGWDGWVYACCSNLTPERGFTLPEEFRLCRVAEFTNWLRKGSHDLGYRCRRCGYVDQNEFLSMIAQTVEDPEFV